jgi:hypothetical protein
MDQRTLVQQAARIAKDLDVLYRAVQEAGGESPDQKVVDILAVPLCKIVRLLIPSVHQKIDEIVYAEEHKLVVQEKQHGADLKGSDGKSIELKTSKCTVRSPNCNFNWPLAACKNEVERKEKVLKSIKEKTGNGGEAVLIVKDGLDREIAKFRLSGVFLHEYFSRLTLGKSPNYNMGCKRCGTCLKFHRLEKLQAASTLYGQDPNSVDWGALLKPCPADCA